MKMLKKYNELCSWFTQGYRCVEMLCSAYISLLASLVLTICMNINFMSWSVFIGLILLIFGCVTSVKATNRINKYRVNYTNDKLVKINLNDYIKKEEQKGSVKKNIILQYICIKTVWIPAFGLMIYFGIQMAKESNQKDNSLIHIEKNTQLIDSILNKTNDLCMQNIILIDSLKSSIKLIEKLTMQIDSLQILNGQVKRNEKNKDKKTYT